jgi:hypothetical protein
MWLELNFKGETGLGTAESCGNEAVRRLGGLTRRGQKAGQGRLGSPGAIVLSWNAMKRVRQKSYVIIQELSQRQKSGPFTSGARWFGCSSGFAIPARPCAFGR